MSFKDSVRVLLKDEKTEQKITYEELSKKTGLTVSSLSYMLNSGRGLTLNNIDKLCEAMNVDIWVELNSKI